MSSETAIKPRPVVEFHRVVADAYTQDGQRIYGGRHFGALTRDEASAQEQLGRVLPKHPEAYVLTFAVREGSSGWETLQHELQSSHASQCSGRFQ